MQNKLLNILTIVVLILVLKSFYNALYQNEKRYKLSHEHRQIEKLEIYSLNHKKDMDIREIKDDIYIINFFASWCNTCSLEFDDKLELSKNINIYGINIRDNIASLKSMLESKGNPYKDIFIDPHNKSVYEFGVSGLPETIIMKKGGIILTRIRGPLNKAVIEDEVKKLAHAS